jgi:hypothetical protein
MPSGYATHIYFIVHVLGLNRSGIKPRSTTIEASTLTIIYHWRQQSSFYITYFVQITSVRRPVYLLNNVFQKNDQYSVTQDRVDMISVVISSAPWRITVKPKFVQDFSEDYRYNHSNVKLYSKLHILWCLFWQNKRYNKFR